MPALRRGPFGFSGGSHSLKIRNVPSVALCNKFAAVFEGIGVLIAVIHVAMLL